MRRLHQRSSDQTDLPAEHLNWDHLEQVGSHSWPRHTSFMPAIFETAFTMWQGVQRGGTVQEGHMCRPIGVCAQFYLHRYYKLTTSHFELGKKKVGICEYISRNGMNKARTSCEWLLTCVGHYHLLWNGISLVGWNFLFSSLPFKCLHVTFSVYHGYIVEGRPYVNGVSLERVPSSRSGNNNTHYVWGYVLA